MKFCTKCGTRLEDETRFCTNCGQPADGSNAATHQTNNTQTHQHPVNTAPAAQQKKKSPMVFILIAVGIVVVIALIATMCSAFGGDDGFGDVTQRDTVELDEPTVSPSTAEEEAALDKAYEYLRALAFSYEGLVSQLEYEGFSYTEAVYAADNCGADWYQQAELKALDYLDSLPFSHSGLIEQLEYECFTYDQAVYGADNCDADWYEQAARMAQSYTESMAMSRTELIEQLIYEGFSSAEAEYGANAIGY